jgi:hypothetical protein
MIRTLFTLAYQVSVHELGITIHCQYIYIRMFDDGWQLAT